MYEMKILDSHESFKLFSLNAFNEDYPQIGYEELSWKAVGCCKGIPLALIALGSFLHSKSKTEWYSALQKLEKTPDPEIQNILRLSYAGLYEEAKQIFLDIACFFKRELVEYIVNLLDSYGLYAAIGMRSLLDRALIAISHNCVRMHDLIQELGWDIVCQQSSGNPENRSHLWDSNDIQDVLGNNKNLVNLEEVDLTDSQKLVELPDSSKADNLKSVHLSGCRSLRHIHPSLLSLGKLKLLDILNCAKLERLETKMHSKSLKHLYIKSCTSLSYVSHFSSLQKLLLDGSPVETLPMSIKHLTELKTLSLKGCKMLQYLPELPSSIRHLTALDCIML
ncbi:hypothetical protein S83_028634 [Arachis hypogaea]